MQTRPGKSSHYARYLLAASALTISAALPSQAAPATTSPTTTSSTTAAGDTITLSPFEVTTDRDVGYTASASLAGGRLNTDLRDTAASISVFTKDFLDDIGATTVNEALEYGLNTAAEVGPTGNEVTENNFNFRIRGISGAQRSRNLFRTQLNLDAYNTERLDFSRGPNAILFGEGSPAGLINTSTKTARLDRNFGQVQARFGSFNERRGTLDINRAITSQFGIRANFLWQEADGYREFEFNDKRAGHIAATYRPFRKTTIKAEYEKGDFEENRARPWTPFDRYSSWENAGRPGAGSPTSWGNPLPQGTAGNIGANNIVFFSEGVLAGQPLWTTGQQVLRVSNGPPTVPGLNTSVNVLDESLVPRDANVAGPGARSTSEYDVGSASIEQQIGDDLFIELAMNAEYEERLWVNPIGFADLAYRLDANAYLPTFDAAGNQTGVVANPNFGRPMVFGNRTDRYMKFYREQFRATASYNLKFDEIFEENERLGWWLGTHRLAVMGSTEDFSRDVRNTREMNISPNRVNPLQLNNNNNIVRVSYLDYFSDDPAMRGQRDPSLHPIGVQPIANNPGATVEPGFVNTGWTWQKNELETQMFAMQNFLFDDRIVTTFGWRKDDLTVFGADAVRADNNSPVTGFIRDSEPDRVIPGDTFTRGIVAHVQPWLSVYYNESDNFTSQDAVQLFGVSGETPVVGNRTGEGKDAGIKTRFFDDKLHATLGWYRTQDANQVSFINGVYPRFVEAIWDALGQPIEIEGRDTRTIESEGYEFELTANPTRQLRLSVNVKKAETTVDRILPTVSSYAAANRAQWLSNASAPIDTTAFGGLEPTVGGVVDQFEEQLMIDRAQEGQSPFQDREITGSFFGTYRFDTGPLDGLTIGGGAQYRGPALITYRVASDGSAVYTDAYAQANAMIAYSRRLSDKYTFRVQLNVDNLFDFQDPQPVAGGQPTGPTTLPLIDGVAYTVSLPIPRRYALTFTLGF